MKFLFLFFVFIAGCFVGLHAQKGNRILLMDGKLLKKSLAAKSTDTIHLKKAALLKAKTFTVRFENDKKTIWKRNTWLQNDNVNDPSNYSYRLPAANGTITIPAKVMRTVLKGEKYVEIWTSLQPANDMMMVRETRELIYTIVID